MSNHGRFQAQGTQSGNGKGAKLERSVKWDQENDYYKNCGLTDLNNLKSKLTDKQLKLRADAFEKAKDEVIRCAKNGGVYSSDYAPKSILVWGTKCERVDIEVNRGRAFLPRPSKKGSV